MNSDPNPTLDEMRDVIARALAVVDDPDEETLALVKTVDALDETKD